MLAQSNKYSVLYVEDDKAVREQYSDFLRRRFDTLYVAADGREGLNLYREHTPDIVITDLRMPVMDGIEMIRNIRAENGSQKIIITSAHGDIDYTLTAIDLNVDKYLLKPIKGSFFDKVIEEVKDILQLERDKEIYNSYIETIINTQPSMVILNTKLEILIANKTFLAFTECASVEEFYGKYRKLQLIFEKEEGYYYSAADDWMEDVYNRQNSGITTEVKIKDKVFVIFVNKVQQHDEYVVTLAEITLQKMFQEKLSKRVEEELETVRKQEQVIFEQKKLADLGQMISAIAHQWRQPINAIGLSVQCLTEEYKAGTFTLETLERSEKIVMDLVRHLSNTIKDFRLFFKDGKETQVFGVVPVMWELFRLVSVQFSAKNINLRFKYHADGSSFECIDFTVDSDCDPAMFMIKGNMGEFKQAMINIIYNAVDAIEEKREDSDTKLGLIDVDVREEGGQVVIVVADNGIGIQEKAMSSIFNPYFTTKEEGKGTGIGLYMTKIVIEDHMKGKISASNTESGAEFTIKFPAAR